MSPLLLAAAAGGAYLLYTKMQTPGLSSGTRPGTPTVDVPDPQTGVTFQAQVVSSFADGTKMVDVFVKSSGARILRFQQTGDDKNSRVFIMSPPGVDANIAASAMRAYGIRPKAGA